MLVNTFLDRMFENINEQFRRADMVTPSGN